MNERVEENKDPDGHRHVADASPHAHHGTGVVVRLQSRAELALGKDDEGVKDLIELAEIEQPTIEGQPFVPHAPSRKPAWDAIGTQHRLRRIRLPRVGLIVEESSIAQTCGSVDTAQRIDEARGSLGAERADDSPPQSTEHPPPCPRRVDSQEDIMRNDEPPEGQRLTDGPWLLAGGLVVGVQSLGGYGIDGRDGDGNLRIEDGVVNMVWDVDWRGKRRAAGRRRGDKPGVRIGRKPKKGRLR